MRTLTLSMRKEQRQRRALLATAAVLSLLAALHPAIPIAMGASRAVQFTSADNGKSARLVAGQTMVVRLPATPGTGYGWEVSARLPFLALLESDFEGGQGIPGGSGEQVFRFRVEAVGEGRLVLEYVRPWEKGVAPEEVFTLHIIAVRH
jgi:inhibitor of cysteine peptidase